jgi:serine/threonine-protein kinase
MAVIALDSRKMLPARGHQVLGSYVLGERLGVGGMAEVFAAESETLGTVALKRILPGLAEDRGFSEMFWDEARLTSCLDHPNVVRVLDYGRVDGQLFMALEFVDGPSLARVLRKAASARQHLPPQVVVSLGVELLDALAFVHSAVGERGEPLGIIHRDVSPGNVLLASSGQVKLGDFGIVRSAAFARRTMPGELKGKLGYMSPEQALGGPLDARSDLFSAGIILAELCLLRPLLLGKSEAQTLTRTAQADLSTWHRFNTEVPLGLRAVVERALRAEPGERFQSARAMRQALLDLARAQGWSLGPAVVRAALVGLELVEDGRSEKAASGERLIGSGAVLGSGVPRREPSGELEMVQPLGQAPRAAGKPVWQVAFRKDSLPTQLILALRRAPSGLIELCSASGSATLELAAGRLVAVADSGGHAPLGRLLVEQGVLAPGDLLGAIGAARRAGLRLGEYLVHQRRLRESTLLRLLRQQSDARLAPWLHAPEGTLTVFLAPGQRLGDVLEAPPESVAQLVGALRASLSPEELTRRLEPVQDAILLPAPVHDDPAHLGLTAPEVRVLQTTQRGGVYEGRSVRHVLSLAFDERIARRSEAAFAVYVGLHAGLLQAPGFGLL